jgi:hypothetical protein
VLHFNGNCWNTSQYTVSDSNSASAKGVQARILQGNFNHEAYYLRWYYDDKCDVAIPDADWYMKPQVCSTFSDYSWQTPFDVNGTSYWSYYVYYETESVQIQ